MNRIDFVHSLKDNEGDGAPHEVLLPPTEISPLASEDIKSKGNRVINGIIVVLMEAIDSISTKSKKCE